jgi:hypothetical protein
VFDNLASTVKSDFARARFKAFLKRVRNLLAGGSQTLLSYDEIKEKLRIGGPIYRGIQTVPLDKIAGSLNRYEQFDRAFMPLQDWLARRWENVDRAFYQDVSLPPVVLYKVGDVYFVVDGHHRVSVGRQQGQQFIEADVRECSTKVNITPDLKVEDLEILGEKVEFLERTALDRIRPKANIKLTIPGGFDRLLEHIAVHRYFMGIDLQRDITEQEAVAHWYDKVYLPIVGVIRRSGVLRDFPGKTEGDLYLWVLDRQRELSTKGRALMPPARAARDFIDKGEE